MDVEIPALGSDREPRGHVLERVIATPEWDGLVTPFVYILGRGEGLGIGERWWCVTSGCDGSSTGSGT
jgi:hypothetical protein